MYKIICYVLTYNALNNPNKFVIIIVEQFSRVFEMLHKFKKHWVQISNYMVFESYLSVNGDLPA